MKLEKDFQKNLVKEIEGMFPGCYVLKTDPSNFQGIPDLLILHNNKWAALECKRTNTSSKRPNQDYYVNQMDKMSFARTIYPENKQEVLYELQQALHS